MKPSLENTCYLFTHECSKQLLGDICIRSNSVHLVSNNSRTNKYFQIVIGQPIFVSFESLYYCKYYFRLLFSCHYCYFLVICVLHPILGYLHSNVLKCVPLITLHLLISKGMPRVPTNADTLPTTSVIWNTFDSNMALTATWHGSWKNNILLISIAEISIRISWY